MEDLVIAGLRDAVAFHKGEAVEGARVRTRTVRDTTVAPPPEFDAKRVVAIRNALEVSQSVFANVLNVSPALVRGWEQGARVPNGAAQRLLQFAEKRADYIVQVARIARPTSGEATVHSRDFKSAAGGKPLRSAASSQLTQRSVYTKTSRDITGKSKPVHSKKRVTQ